MEERESECGFCKSKAKFWSFQDIANYFTFHCPICRFYFITGNVYYSIKERKIDNTLLWCISENIKHNSTEMPVMHSWHSTREQDIPKLNSDIIIRKIEHFEGLPVSHAEKPQELLKRIAEKVGNQAPFSKVKISLSDLYLLKIRDEEEAYQWIKQLSDVGYVKINEFIGVGFFEQDNAITSYGWEKVASLTNQQNSNKGFIAMSFGYSERDKLEDAIGKACEEAGWEAKTIDRHEYVGGVVDEIIAGINESRFVIADLTEHKNGVYFEAGYAIGRGIPVIFTVKDDPKESERVHFDVQHLNQIRWKDYDDLKYKLVNRMKAILPK